eukprot:CAMPEP_0119269500 /NCGR_PEP_ID=MMETSP1329-20130426/6891_1 /TAXON_ID=114041 /ORGANISM="Genus nov. species nov., Strain RCC1024" /LENGTH=89 /DNA_ID=CAMNT_0007269499 /DNA_START=62 /DNA_END=328 /DNA_ORIENTATION=-
MSGGGGGGEGPHMICFDFKAGRCNRGENCKYSHDGGLTAGKGMAATSAGIRATWAATAPCGSRTAAGGARARARWAAWAATARASTTAA